MQQPEKLDAFYRRKMRQVPDGFYNSAGHFNIFRLDPYVGHNAKPVPYIKRDFYKIMLVFGQGRVHYADRITEVKKQALSFSNPHIPYKWENTDQVTGGIFCIFNTAFFHQFGNLDQYPLFHPQGQHIFELDDEQVKQVEVIYQRMFEEINSEYIFKHDALRNLVFELIHFAMKLQPSTPFEKQEINAAQRICMLFTDLLERQFPIEENHPRVQLRTASDFAERLNIHVNHLNRSVREVTQKTTSQIIAERILQEAKALLKHSNWNISEIAYALGFAEATHFSNFFKKYVKCSPTQFRKG